MQLPATKVSECIQLIAKSFRLRGFFHPYSNEVLTWTKDLEVFSLEFWTYSDRIELELSNGIKQTIKLDFTDVPSPYVGIVSAKRAWFLCPKCDSRRSNLILYQEYFYCRKCHGLNYTDHRSVVPRRRKKLMALLAKPPGESQ